MLNLIDHLPRHSFFGEALATDEEIAAVIAGREMPESQQRFSEWSPLHEVMVAAVERLDHIANVLLAVNQNTPGKPFRWPRPVSAVEKYRANHKAQVHESLVDRLLPKE